MGRRGPPKKPTELKLLQGCPGGKHKLNPLEPKPDKVKKAAPKFRLGKLGKKIWRELSQQLEATGILTVLDLHALTRLCYLIEEWESLRTFIQKNGRTYEVYYERTEAEVATRAELRLKKIAQRPELILMNQLGKEINRLEQQFGLSPSSRTGLSVRIPSGKRKDSVDDRLFG